MNFLEQTFLDQTLLDWVVTLGVAVGLTAVFYLTRKLIIKRLKNISRATHTRVDDHIADILSHTRLTFLFLLAIYLSLHYLNLPSKAQWVVDQTVIIVFMLQVAIWANRGLALWLADSLARRRETDAGSATTLTVIGFIGRILLWSIVLLMILDNLGVNITALVASLGIGGIAVALAMQNLLGDILASLAIALDKPFVIGDFIIVDDDKGTIEYIGLKTTRLRSLSGEQIIVSNADLLNSRIHNYKRMAERRVLFTFGVIYQTPYEKLQNIPKIARAIIEAQPKTRFDRAHFKEYGDSSLDFEVVYYVLDREYNIYMDAQQAINLALFERFQNEGIEFAYPTRTLYVNQAVPQTPSSGSA